MLYNININQKAVHDAGLVGKLSIESIIIFDLMCKAFADFDRITFEGKEYAWFAYTKISNELPILEFKKDTIYRKIKELIDNKFIEAHPDNRKMGKTFFYLSKEAKTLMTGIGLKSDGTETGTDKNPNNIRIKIRESKSDKNPYNNSTTNRNYNNTNDNKEVSVVTDTPPLESKKESSEVSSTEIPNNCENENLSLKEKSTLKNKTRGAGGENSQSDVGKLDLDKDIAPLGMNDEKLDFIFLESSRIDTSEIRAKFTMWHERRARKTKGVRNCMHYQKIMRLVANSDLSESEVIEGLNMAYEKTWTGLEIEWIKNKTRQNKTQQQNGTNNRLAQQKQYIADSPLFKGL